MAVPGDELSLEVGATLMEMMRVSGPAGLMPPNEDVGCSEGDVMMRVGKWSRVLVWNDISAAKCGKVTGREGSVVGHHHYTECAGRVGHHHSTECAGRGGHHHYTGCAGRVGGAIVFPRSH